MRVKIHRARSTRGPMNSGSQGLALMNVESVQTRRSFGRCAYLDSQLPADLADVLWRAPLQVLSQGQPLRQGGFRSTVRLDWAGRLYVLKHYVEATWRHSLKQNVTRSRARNTWLTAHRLADAGIATPRPVACVENRFGPFRGDSYLMYPYVEGQTLRSYLGCDETQHRPLVTEIREQLISFWSRLKQLRVSLGDSNLQNFIIGQAGQLWVIDVDKARFHSVGYVAARRYERGLQQLARSARKTGGWAGRLVEEISGRL